MRLPPLLLALLLAPLLAMAAARAEELDLPGLAGDTAAYQRDLARRFPAGATPQQRAAAEARAAGAERQQNWAAAAQAWEERAGSGEARPEHWLALARAQLQRTPPEPARALQAAWQAFQMLPTGAAEIPALLVMADALQRLDRPAQQIRALQAAVERAPDTPRLRQALAEARRAAGLLVAGIATEPEAEPARACLRFTTPPARRTDWQPADWVRTEPPIPGLAVLREGEQLCLAGLPHGQATRVILRPGLPGEDGLRLNRETTLRIAMPDRAARIAFDASRFILPRGQAQRVGLATVNLSALALKVVRVSERNLLPFARNGWTPGEAIAGWNAEDIPESWGATVWEGRVELPARAPNRTERLALPLPEALRRAGPGLYALVVRPADGAKAAAAALPVIVTDLGLTAWRGPQGLAVQARGLAGGRPLAGARIRLLSLGNDILAEAEAGADGTVRFAGPLLRGQGPMAPRALHASLGEDFVALDLDAAAFDLSDRGAGGAPQPGPLEAWFWLDRGIYRPGETVQAMALLRDAAGAPRDLPARLRVRRPNGSVFAESVPARGPGASLAWPVALPAGAPAGLWSIEAFGDPAAPPIGRAEFRVEAFVPERLAVTAGPAPGPLVPGQALKVPVAARFLYGAPAAGLAGDAELRLLAERSPFPAYKDYVFGLQDEEFAPELLPFEIEPLDAAGEGVLSLALPRTPDTTRPLRAEVAIAIDEPGGRASRTSLSLPVRGPARLIGVRPLFADLAVDAGAEAGFEIVVLDAEARPVAARLRARLLRERPDWRIVARDGQARYETVWRDEPVDSAALDIAAGQPARFARSLPFGRYRLEVSEAGGGLAVTSLRFRAGWAGGETAEVPDKVDVAADRRAYAPGETARLRITPPFAGPASLAVLTDHLVAIREIEVAEGGTEVELPVDPGWGAGAYVAVTAFHPGETREGQPGRALGLAWLQLDPAARRLDVALAAPAGARPGRRLEVPLRLSPATEGAMVTLTAVDEGILRLTRFAAPDPLGHFLGQRRLGVDIRDDYGRLIPPPEGEPAVLRQGGDEVALPDLAVPQRSLALFSGPVAVAPDGTATIALDIPDFAGELRLMAVAWAGERLGAASQPVTIRDPVVAEPALPRFLAPGDEARLPVLLHNLELPAGEVAVDLTAEGAIGLAGPARLAASLAPGARALPASALRATASGEGVLRLAVSGPDGFRALREARITVRSSRPLATDVAAQEIPPGAERALPLDPGRWVAGSWVATARFGGPVRYDATGMLQQLERYPFGCLEQSASRLLAFALAPGWGEAAEAGAARMQRAAQQVLDKQRFDGGFGLWSAQGEAEEWTGAYAVEALLRAQAAGAALPEAALAAALQAIAEQAEDVAPDTPEAMAAQAYRLHVLALAGQPRPGAARRLLEQLEALPTPLARAQLGAAFAHAGDRARAEQAFAAALQAPAREGWIYDYGSAARDALAVALLLRESGVLAGRLPEAIARLPGPDFAPARISTQEQAWGVAAAAVLGRDGRPVRLALDGREQPPAPLLALALTAPGRARNLGEAPFWASLSVTGIPVQPAPAGRSGLRISRRFLDAAGQPVDLDQLRQNQVFVLLLEGRNESGQPVRALVQQGLPAGWEILGRLAGEEVPGMPWLGPLSETEAMPALDDRFAAALELTPQEPEFRLAVRLRAVTAGRFELPGAQVEDMVRPAFFARQNTGRVAVLGPDDPAPAPPQTQPQAPSQAQPPLRPAPPR
ncbi:alpha-2-macroglobulin family protein [Roseicella frigidaeris]|uniref:Alpha-2-macroglobulin family protein n=1 Tax=Roseicella frigidaeris TaxID=2230885 RepID=A0A327MB06_9PROT|nr:alpha-2-macroglobulin [Roseicella frigidaeris]RAI59717.1 alpha-2-macroglobulin family protein [Roseicella frigidaeris]